jgi:pimeloyl-ACP methyl ester carboxylesterase
MQLIVLSALPSSRQQIAFEKTNDTMDKEIKIAGKKIFYRVHGNGRPVMLVHGFGETSDVWDHQVKFLKDNLPAGEAGFQLIVPDLPGSGQSELLDDMSMEGMAEVLKIILDKEQPPQTPPKEGLRGSQSKVTEDSSTKDLFSQSESSKMPPSGDEGAVMIGHSMGGYITLAFVEKYEGLLRSFGLFHSSAFADSEEKKTTRRKGIEFIKEKGAFEFLKTATPNLFSPRSKDELPELIAEFVQSLNNFSPESLVSYYESMIKRPDRTSVLKNTKLPVLFIMGEFDNAIPLQDGLKQCHMPEKSNFHVLHQSGHMGMLEETEKTNRLLEDFLNKTDASY